MSSQLRTQGSVVRVAALTAGLLAVLVGCAPAEPAAAPSPTATAARPTPLNAGNAAEVLAQLVTTPPTAVSMPDLGIDMVIEPHGLAPDGQMSLPDTPFEAAWYQYGSAPDSVQGSTVIAAHVDSRVYGVGPFSRLRDAQPGMLISVTDAAGVVHTYSVVGVERIPKAEVPLDRVFTAVGDPHLVLVTCGGGFIEELRNYTDNYIVTAEKVS